MVGSYLPQPEVKDDAGRNVLVDEILGSSFAVIGLDRDPSPHFDALSDALSIRCLTFGQSAAGATMLTDPTGTLQRWFAEHNAEFVIIRPDRFVFGAYTVGTIADASAELMAQLGQTTHS